MSHQGAGRVEAGRGRVVCVECSFVVGSGGPEGNHGCTLGAADAGAASRIEAWGCDVMRVIEAL